MRSTPLFAIACTGCLSFSLPPPPACGLRTFDELSLGNAFDPWLSQDRLEIIFSSDFYGTFGGSLDLVRAARNTVDDPFSLPAPLSINTPADETGPFVSDDGTTLYFSQGDQVMSARRIGLTMFDTPVALAGIQGRHASLSRDQLDIYFSFNDQIRVAHRDASDGSFGSPVSLTLPGDGGAIEPSISADGQTLVFASGVPGTGQTFLSRATRSALGEFGHVEAISESEPVLGTSDRSPQLHHPAFSYPDETIVFTSNRTASSDLWIACE